MDSTYSTTTFAVATATICLAFAVLFKRKSASDEKSVGLKHPPMMPWLPIVGSLPFIPDYSQFHEFFTKKAQTMGPVIGFYMGKQYTVMVTGREALHDALARKTDLASRPMSFSKTKYFNPNYKGFGEHLYCERFQYHHKLALNILKDFGFGKQVMETRIRIGVDQVIENIRTLQGAEFDPDEIVTSGIFSIISNILFNKQFGLGHPELIKIIKLEHQFFTEYYDFMAVDAFQSLLYLPSYQRLLDENIKHKGELMQWIAREILNAVNNKDDGESFVSSFLDREKSGYDYEQLIYMVRDLILGGTDTSASLTQWFIIYMANHPAVQAKVQHEIDAVIGSDREITFDDEKNLSYTQATILELLRRQTVAALGLPHCAMKDTHILDYCIPAGTTVLTNLYGSHMDPKSWKNPEEFIPERFLDSSGKVVGKEKIVAFSMGKRSCVGEQLARQEIFLLCSSLAQHFQILPPEGQERIAYRERVFLTTVPTSFKARLIPRIQK